MSGLTGAQFITQFRTIGGFNTVNPTNPIILGHINNIRRGMVVSSGPIAVCPLLDLYPALSGEMGALAVEREIDLLADTERYACAAFDKLAKASVKYGSSDDFTAVSPERVLNVRLDYNSPLADAADTDNPILAFYGGYVSIFPRPGEGVTGGLLLDILSLPADDITASSSAVAESRRICLAEVKAALGAYYASMEGKENECAKWVGQAFNDIQRIRRESPGRALPQKMIFGGNNLSKYLD